jgi:hypothetical protein
MPAQTAQNSTEHAADTKDAAKPQERSAPVGPKIDLSQLKSSYCNVCNVTSTREELVLTFGLNQSWDISSKREDMEISLQHRVHPQPVRGPTAFSRCSASFSRSTRIVMVRSRSSSGRSDRSYGLTSAGVLSGGRSPTTLSGAAEQRGPLPHEAQVRADAWAAFVEAATMLSCCSRGWRSSAAACPASTPRSCSGPIGRTASCRQRPGLTPIAT